MRFKQAVAPQLQSVDGLGWCLRFTQTAFAAPVRFPSATAAWYAQHGRHEGAVPPLGVAVPIWFEHYGWYGTPLTFGNWGHVAVRLADGRVLTSPFFGSQLDGNGVGQAIYPSIQAMCDAMPGGAKYIGYSEYMNGLRIVEPALIDPLGEEEDEDMRTTKKAMFYMDGTSYNVVIGDTASGWAYEYTTVDAKVNNQMAALFETGDFGKSDRSMVAAFSQSLAAVRSGRAG